MYRDEEVHGTLAVEDMYGKRVDVVHERGWKDQFKRDVVHERGWEDQFKWEEDDPNEPKKKKKVVKLQTTISTEL